MENDKNPATYLNTFVSRVDKLRLKLSSYGPTFLVSFFQYKHFIKIFLMIKVYGMSKQHSSQLIPIFAFCILLCFPNVADES